MLLQICITERHGQKHAARLRSNRRQTFRVIPCKSTAKKALSLHNTPFTIPSPAEESNLLRIIKRGTPPEIQTRYHELMDKRKAQTLTAQVEAMAVKRLESLSQLARIRQNPLTASMKELYIQTPAYG